MVAAALLAIVIVVQLRPGSYRVARTMETGATPEAVYRRLEDLRQWSRWSPWRDLDEAVKRKYEGPRRGLGASYTWEGSGSIGRGKVTIVEADEPHRVEYRVEFIAPWNATVQNMFAVEKLPTGARVTWTIAGERHFWSKLFGFFSDPSEALGTDMDRGLTSLKALIERVPSS